MSTRIRTVLATSVIGISLMGGSSAVAVETEATGEKSPISAAFEERMTPVFPVDLRVALQTGFGKCVDVISANQNDGAEIQQYTCVSEPQQTFEVVELADRYIALRAAHSKKCLDARANNTADGVAVLQWKCTESPSQQFALFQQTIGGENTYAVVPRSTYEANPLRPKCLDVRGATAENTARIQTWACDSISHSVPDVSQAQRFTFVKKNV